MKYCEKCNVTVRGKGTNCPLCQNKLRGSEEEEIFPKLQTIFTQYEMFFKMAILAGAVAGIGCVAVNLILPQTGNWSFFVVLGLICFGISLTFAVKKRHNIPKNITNQVIIISLASVLWDAVTNWRGWSLDYVIPIVCIMAMLSLAILAKVKNLPVIDYIASFIADIFFGIVPLIFYLTKSIHVVIPTVLCIAVSLVSLTWLLLFEGRNIRIELSKRFHL